MTKRNLFCLIAACSILGYACHERRSQTPDQAPKTGEAGPLSKRKATPTGYKESSKGGWTTIRHGSGVGSAMDGRRGKGAGEMDSVAAAKPAPTRTPGMTGARRRHIRRPIRVQVGPLKAGEIDDNAKWKAFITYHRANSHLVPANYRLDVSERYVITAKSKSGKTLPNARVIIQAGGKVLLDGLTDSRGRLLFFPLTVSAAKGATSFQVTFGYAGQEIRQKLPRNVLTGGSALTVTLPVEKQTAAAKLEVLFLLDTTGSMSDEIRQVQQTLLSITRKIRSLQSAPAIRYGMVLYRDRRDSYVVKRYGFTSDVAAFDRALRQVRAAGGGDFPESMNMGLFTAVDQMPWSKDALRLVFLVADAPPHLDYQQDVPYAKTLKSAVAKGIKIFPTAASGLDKVGSYVMRQIAQFTQAKFLFIEYGQSGASHGIKRGYQTNNLDDIILRIVKEELEHYAR